MMASNKEDPIAELSERFRIPPESLKAAHVRRLSDSNARLALGIHGYVGEDISGIYFPYWSPLTGERVGARIRLDHPLKNGAKYLSERGCKHFFFPPNVGHFLSDTSVPVLFVEAEKSALALAALAVRTGRPMLLVAIGGCAGWKRKAGNRPLPNGGTAAETTPGPDLDMIAWQDRLTKIVFDSNARTNANVRRARWQLAHELCGRGANMLIADVPDLVGVNGPDDLIAVSDDQAVVRLLDAARPFAECAIAEAERLIAVLEETKDRRKADPLAALEAVAAIGDTSRRELLIGRIAALHVPGFTKAFCQTEIGQYRDAAAAASQAAKSAAKLAATVAQGKAINASELLDTVRGFIRRYMVLSNEQLDAVTLWVAHTHAIDAAEFTPYLAITSAEKQSGKTRILEILETLTANPWLTGRVTAAVLYRKIDAERPTLLLDESDAAFNGEKEYAEALRGVLNTGYQKIGKASCCVGKGADISYHDFSTFCPKAIAGIGRLPDTVADRAIPIRLKRAMRDEQIERFRRRDVAPKAASLRSGLQAWSAFVSETIRVARPELPSALTDRQWDTTEPLLAIADAAGGKWPERARRAFIQLCAETRAEHASIGVQLLADIRDIFAERQVGRLSSKDLIDALADIETSPWAEWCKGKPLSQPKLAHLLEPFRILPDGIRIGKRTPRGYLLEDFRDAFERYLPPRRPQSATAQHTSPGAGSGDFSGCNADTNVAGEKCANTSKNAACCGVADPEPPAETRGVEETL
jgi:hypothetical protein